MTILGFIREELKNKYPGKLAYNKYLLLCKLLNEKSLQPSKAGFIELRTLIENELQEIERNLPEKISYDSFQIIPLNPITTWGAAKKVRHKPIKKHAYKLNGNYFDKTSGDVLFKRKNDLTNVIELLDRIFQFIKLYELEYSTNEVEINQHSAEAGKTKSKKKRGKGFTKPKEEQFIELFIKNSLNESMEVPKDIARLTSVSVSWISTHFKKIRFIEKLHKAMEQEYHILANNHANSNCFDDNFALINRILDNLKIKIAYNSGKIKTQRKEILIDDKPRLKKILST